MRPLMRHCDSLEEGIAVGKNLPYVPPLSTVRPSCRCDGIILDDCDDGDDHGGVSVRFLVHLLQLGNIADHIFIRPPPPFPPEI